MQRKGWHQVFELQGMHHKEIYHFLSDLQMPIFNKLNQWKGFLDKVCYYFLKNGKMWKQFPTEPIQDSGSQEMYTNSSTLP